jgi:hypothetical protein
VPSSVKLTISVSQSLSAGMAQVIEEAAAYYLLRLELDLDFKVAFLFAFCSITVNNG